MPHQSSSQRIGPGAKSGSTTHSRTSSQASLNPRQSHGPDLAGDVLPAVGNDWLSPSSQKVMAQDAGTSRAFKEIPPVPFPPPPARGALERDTLLARQQTDLARGNLQGRAHQIGFDPPAESQLYPGNKSVDCKFWTGNHPEDVMSEQTIKHGFTNKATITNESNTARPLLWSQLKNNKSGLQTLSSLFIAVLEKRQNSGRLLAPSTFKPPPRASLTGTKRENWLSDLANPACPLRKFSRTIPYGISNRGLLEQCLAKQIPVARAVWLAKCIGANELRTLKRKGNTGAMGPGAELKWISQWTIHVEQFIEHTAASTSDTKWKERIEYMFRFTYYLYIEQLLDEDHFCDWLLSSLERSTPDHLPLWIVHVQLYWRFLVSSRKRGRRLAEALCEHLHTASAEPDNADIFKPIIDKLHVLLGLLIVKHQSCMLIPKSWAKYERTLNGMPSHPSFQDCLAEVARRNNRLARPLWEQSEKSGDSARHQVFILLDSIGYIVDMNNICHQLLSQMPPGQELAWTVLEWATSFHRHGSHRIYLANRILQVLARADVDVEDCVLSYVMAPRNPVTLDMNSLIAVVAELVRSRAFAIQRVFRAVISRGAMNDTDCDQSAASRLRLLVRGVPTYGLPQHVENLQINLLRDTSVASRSVEETLGITRNLIDQALGVDQKPMHPLPYEELTRLTAHTLASRFKISMHIRSRVRELLSSTKCAQDPGFKLRLFCQSRDMLELLGDFPLVADLVRICMPASDGDTFTAAIETIDNNSICFAAVGALVPLTKEAIGRYEFLRRSGPLEKAYITALLRLLTSLNGYAEIVSQLQFDLPRCEPAIAISSPASDNAHDVASCSLESEEEIERILASGTTMDENSIRRVFFRLLAHLAMSSKVETRSEWFTRLRAFDEPIFDGLMRSWLPTFLLEADLATCRYALPILIGSQVISFAKVGLVAASLNDSRSDDKDVAIRLAAVTLSVYLLPPSKGPARVDPESYKFRLLQQKAKASERSAIAALVINAFRLIDDDAMASTDLKDILQHPAVLEFIVETTCNQPDLFSGRKLNNISKAGTQLFTECIGRILRPSKDDDIHDPGESDKISQLMRTVDELSLPLCRTQMQLLLQDNAKSASTGIDTSGILFDAIVRNPDAEQPLWLELLDGLHPMQLQSLKVKAEVKILSIVNASAVRLEGDAGGQVDLAKVKAMLRKLLYIVDCAVKNKPSTPVQAHDCDTSGPDRSGAIREVIARHFTAETENKMQDNARSDFTRALMGSLLHLLAVRKLSVSSTKNDWSSTLSLLLAIMQQGHFERFRLIDEFLFDTAQLLSDDLSDEARANLIKTELPKYSDHPRVSFILGFQQASDTWLGLVTSNNAGQINSANISTMPPTPAARSGVQQAGIARYQQAPKPAVPQRGPSTPQLKSFNPPMPFPLRRWELLPDQGGSTMANDTAISLSLFGARKVS